MKRVSTDDEQQTVIYIFMLFEKYVVSTLLKVNTIKLSFWHYDSVRNFIERESVIAEIFSSPAFIALAGNLDFVRNI